jgi:two-component system sensor histidine kinase DesK
MSREAPVSDAGQLCSSARYRRAAVSAIFIIVILGPAYHLLSGPMTGRAWIQAAGALVMTAMTGWILNRTERRSQHVPWLVIGVTLALGVLLFILGGVQWLGPMAIGAALWGRFSRTARPAILAAGICALAGILVATAHHYTFGNTVSAVVVAPLGGLFAYIAGRRADTVESLRRTRAELARAAVAEERLRIARDLHDLLGHSLSLITLKAELAGRLMAADPDRAALEISELESVARQSLSDVREAVAGFRQPDLAGELAAARQLLDAAGIASQISASGSDGLAQDVDAALAWAVREGITNVVRHSRATHVAIRVTRSEVAAVAEISDDGPLAAEETGREAPAAWPPTAGPDGRAAAIRARPAFTGSGLAGLAERIRGLGGELAAGSVEPRGFLLRVVVPLAPQAGQ